MKYAKILGLLAMAAAALMAFAASASATTGATGTKSSTGTALAVGDVITATSTHTSLHGTVDVTCEHSHVEGEVTNAGSSSETLSGHIDTLSFTNCGANTVTVINKGTLSVHTETSTSTNGNGTLTSDGATVTVLTHGAVGTVHCEFFTENTDIGRLTGSANTGGTATLHIDSAPLKRHSTDFGCGFAQAEWTGHYIVTSPDYLDIH